MSPHKRKERECGSVLSAQGQELNGSVLQAIPTDISEAEASYFIGLPFEERAILLREALVPRSNLENAHLILGVRPGASWKQIKAAYVERVKKYDPEMKPFLFLRIQAAFDLLKQEFDPARDQFDEFTGQAVEEWERHWRDEYKIRVGGSQIFIPVRRPGFDWLMIVPRGITRNQVFAKCESLFPAERYVEGLDADLVRNDRVNYTRAYAIWLRARQEADEELKNFSADQLDVFGHSGQTLLERLIMAPWYFKKTGDHLDVKNWTLCSGSRFSGGLVPVVGRGGGQLQVGYCGPSDASDGLRARSVVS